MVIDGKSSVGKRPGLGIFTTSATAGAVLAESTFPYSILVLILAVSFDSSLDADPQPNGNHLRRTLRI